MTLKPGEIISTFSRIDNLRIAIDAFTEIVDHDCPQREELIDLFSNLRYALLAYDDWAHRSFCATTSSSKNE